MSVFYIRLGSFAIRACSQFRKDRISLEIYYLQENVHACTVTVRQGAGKMPVRATKEHPHVDELKRPG